MKARTIPVAGVAYPRARTPEEEAQRREAIAALMRRRTRLTDGEARLFRQLFSMIFTANYVLICRVLQRRGAPEADVEDLAQNVLFKLYRLCLEGIPESIPQKARGIALGMALNQRRAARRSPLRPGMPSSRSEPAQPMQEIERAIDLPKVARRLRLALSDEHRQAIDAVVIDELSLEAAAEKLKIKPSTLASRLKVAKRRLYEMAMAFLPESERSPS